jgi:3-oxoacyl-[acyl-carrier protein] reductase
MDASPVALVTGSRKGIGRHLAQCLVGRGYQVVGCSREPADWTLPGYAHKITDVADESQVIELLSGIRRQYGTLTALVNNAGIASMNSVLLTPGATIDRIIRTNFIGTALVSREAAKLMMKNRFGRIVNVTTVAVPMALEGEAIYASSKSAVETFTRILARELGPVGITVNAVGPPPVDTDLTRGIPRAKIEALQARLSTGRAGTLDDVANAVEFFIRPESGGVTGQILYLGGP